jgi:hypothetical protein
MDAAVVVRALAPIGNDLNQIVRHLNREGRFDDALRTRLDDALSLHIETLQRFIREMRKG